RDSAALGIWVFLTTEVMFICALFMAYGVYRLALPEAFAQASAYLELWAGGLNTAVLLTSSLTVALAVHAAEHGRRRAILLMIVLTLALGGLFLLIKGIEYATKFEHHLVPGFNFAYES